MKETGASACTDVTGFGLFAHLMRLMCQGKLAAEVYADSLAAFEGAVDALRQGVIPGAVERNREYVGDSIHIAPGMDEALVNLGFDAQTSGGLLVAIAPERLEVFQEALARSGVRGYVIGRVIDGAEREIYVVPGDSERGQSRPQVSTTSSKLADKAVRAPDLRPVGNNVDSSESKAMKSQDPDSAASHENCCTDIFQNEAASSAVSETQRAFGALMRAAQASGALNEKAKELILFGLVVQSRYEPCFDAHYRRARELGITQAELDEAAWCAIAMGGAPVKVFYQECLARVRQSANG